LLWPGDEKFLLSANNVQQREASKLDDRRVENRKRKRDDVKEDVDERVAAHNDVDERPSKSSKFSNDFRNRYFSVENVNKIGSAQAESVESSSGVVVEESQEFTLRKDYLLQKLFQSRNLPNSEVSGEPTKPTAQESASSSDVNKQVNISDETQPQIKPDRKHSFQDEFIPLFKEKETKPLGLDPKLKPYAGPYPFRCIEAVGKFLKSLLEPNSQHNQYESNQNLRTCEILKLKLKMPSKFDNDQRLLRMISRDSHEAKQTILDRMAYIDRQLNRQTGASSSGNVSLSSSSKIIDLVSSEDESKRKSSTDSREQIEDVICMINNEEEEDDDDEDEDEEDEDEDDSKCVQFGKYSKNSKARPNKKNNHGVSLSGKRKGGLILEEDQFEAAANINSRRSPTDNNNRRLDSKPDLKRNIASTKAEIAKMKIKLKASGAGGKNKKAKSNAEFLEKFEQLKTSLKNLKKQYYTPMTTTLNQSKKNNNQGSSGKVYLGNNATTSSFNKKFGKR
jgi:hypothetical protein